MTAKSSHLWPRSGKIFLRGLVLDSLRDFVVGEGHPPFRANQIFRWLHKAGATSLMQMSDLSRTCKDSLLSRVELSRPRVVDRMLASDGTRKLLLSCFPDDQMIETVIIPRNQDPERSGRKYTVCTSTHVGCPLGCRFCATATLGLKRRLRTDEIVDQVYLAREELAEGESISNVVFMGMGEPLLDVDPLLESVAILTSPEGLNLSPRKLTVSTVGYLPGILELKKRRSRINLAISLHATSDKVRSFLIPINRKWPLEMLFSALADYPLKKGRRITFEYLLFRGLNDGQGHARKLVKLVQNLPAKVNLALYNPCRNDCPALSRPSDDVLSSFSETLHKAGLAVTIRRTRGLDIGAACGQLAPLPAGPT